MVLPGRDSKVHWSVKESTLRSIFTPSREALITTLKAPRAGGVSFVFVFQAAHNYKIFSNIFLFALTETPLQISGEAPRTAPRYSVRLCQGVLVFIRGAEIGRSNETLLTTPSCSRRI